MREGARHVAIDARYLKRPDVGIGVYLSGLVDDIAARGHRVTLLTDDRDHAAALARSRGVTAVALRMRTDFLWEQVAAARWAWRERPDVLLAGANHGLPLVARRGVRRVQVAYDLIPLRFASLYRRFGVVWFGRYLVSTAISLLVARAVIAISRSTARDVRRLGARGVVVRRPPPPRPSGDGDGPPPGWPRRYLLYNGGRDPRKNVPRLLEAFARHRRRGGDHALVLMGRGYEDLLPAAAELGVRDAVVLTGYVDEETKGRGIAACAALVYPSRWEGWGLPVMEGLAAGVPVVCGRGGALAEVGGDAVHAVDVDSAAAIADGIARAVTPDARERARADGPRRIGELEAEATDDWVDALTG
ncbi:MAG: glycosyltransferase family 4 protein [Thermoleophilia bacterium]